MSWECRREEGEEMTVEGVNERAKYVQTLRSEVGLVERGGVS